jgi:4-amino-4-deoxy-L-arabinose transferase-like glycosyltransferase
MSSASPEIRRTLFSPSLETRRLILLVAGSLLIFAAGIGMRALWNPNEPVYGEGVREMMVQGDYYLPHVNGKIYTDKPILYFWAMLASCLLTGGLSEAALRLPSVAGGVLSVLLVYRLGRHVFGIRAGFLAASCLATSVMFWWHSQYVQMDQMLSLLILGAMVSFFTARETATRSKGLLLAASGACMGLAFLTKGPVGLVVPAAAMGIYLIALKEWRWIFRKEVAGMAAAFLLLAAPWFVSLALTGRSWILADFFIKHNLERATDPFNHAQPFWYYGPRLMSDLFPWSLFLPLAFFTPARDRMERRGRLFAILWLSAVFLIFSAAGSKRGVYLLPLYPAAALLLGKFWDEILSGGMGEGVKRWTGWILVFPGIFLCVSLPGGAGALLWAARSGKYRPEAMALLPMTAMAFAGGVWLLASLRRRRTASAVAALTLAMAGVYLYSDLFLLRLADRHKSPVPFSRKVTSLVGPEDEIRSRGLWRWDSSYLFYTGRLMPQIRTQEELDAYLAQDRKVFLLVESDNLDRFLATLKSPVSVLVREEIGGKPTALLANRPGPSSPTS